MTGCFLRISVFLAESRNCPGWNWLSSGQSAAADFSRPNLTDFATAPAPKAQRRQWAIDDWMPKSPHSTGISQLKPLVGSRNQHPGENGEYRMNLNRHVSNNWPAFSV